MTDGRSDTPQPELLEEELSEFAWLTTKLVTLEHLERCDALLSLLHTSLSLPVPTMKADRNRSAIVLADVLGALAAAARQSILGGKLTPTQYKDACHVAAAGELFGFTDEEQIKERLSKIGKALVYKEQYARHDTPKARRQVRAAVWLYDGGNRVADKLNPITASPKRKQRMLLEATRTHLLGYITSSAATLRQRLENGPAIEAAHEIHLPAGPRASDSLFRPNYVQRKQIEAQFKSLIESGAKLIAFNGLPGMGKTWLAQAVATQLHPEHKEAPVIRVAGGKVDIADLQGTLTSFGVETQHSIAGDPREFLAMLLCSDKAPLCTIIDGLDSADGLYKLLPSSGTRHVVIATCLDTGKSPPENCRFIKVSEMETEEAIELVHKRLPTLGRAD